MITEKEIRESLKRDPYWELPDTATDEEWELFDRIYEELDSKGELKFTDDLNSNDMGGSNDDDVDGDPDIDNWDDIEEDSDLI